MVSQCYIILISTEGQLYLWVWNYFCRQGEPDTFMKYIVFNFNFFAILGPSDGGFV